MGAARTTEHIKIMKTMYSHPAFYLRNKNRLIKRHFQDMKMYEVWDMNIKCKIKSSICLLAQCLNIEGLYSKNTKMSFFRNPDPI